MFASGAQRDKTAHCGTEFRQVELCFSVLLWPWNLDRDSDKRSTNSLTFSYAGYSRTLSVWTKLERQRPPLLYLADDDWEALTAEELKGGTVPFFYWLMTKPVLSLNGPFHGNHQLRWTIPPETTPGSACVNASYKECSNPGNLNPRLEWFQLSNTFMGREVPT